MNTYKLNHLTNRLSKLLRASRVNLKSKINTEILPKLNYFTAVAQRIMDSKQNIVWFDGEMTGLDPDKHTLIEAAIIVTDKDLCILAESPNIIIHQSDNVLKNMEEWPKEQHALSGLTEKVRKSTVSIEQADQILYDFIQPFSHKGVCPLAGNSIYMDRSFIKKYMPKLESQLSYRLIDVSTLNELYRRWEPEVINEMPKKLRKHRALEDIRESIQELKFYKKKFMLPNNSN